MLGSCSGIKKYQTPMHRDYSGRLGTTTAPLDLALGPKLVGNHHHFTCRPPNKYSLSTILNALASVL